MFPTTRLSAALCLSLAVCVLGWGTASAGTLFSDNFDTGTKKPREGGVGWASSTLVSVSDDIARSGKYSLKFVFEGKPTGSDAWAEQRFALGADYQEVEVSWYAYYPDGTEGLGARFEQRSEAPGNNKFIRLWKGNEADNNNGYGDYFIKLGASTWPQGAGDANVGLEYGTDRKGVGVQGIPRFGDFVTNDFRGRWMHFRYVARVASAVGKSDGSLRLYRDGRLIMSEDGLPLFSDKDNRPALNYGYLLGWANTGFDKETYLYIDDVVISGTSAAQPAGPANVKVE